MRQWKTAARNGKHGMSIVWEEEMSWCPERVSVGQDGEGHILDRGAVDRKGARTQSGKSWYEESGG